ncbi:MAG: LysR family transcriptional regulator, partial [Gammaproteobacteria bacterium]
AAAKLLGMSYRRAWLLVDTMNRCFNAPVVGAEVGGAGGGGARLTACGEEVLTRYRAMERHARTAIETEFAAFGELLRREPR